MPANPWLITGAADGIGLAVARRLIELGIPLLALGRRAFADLGEMPFSEDRYLAVDLQEQNVAERVDQWLEKLSITQLAGLIHIAAVGWVGELTKQPSDSISEIVRVNLLAPISLSRQLAERCERVVFISSVVAEWGAANYSVYAASKAALNALTRSWRAEEPGCLVQTLHLGAVATGLHRKCGWEVPPKLWAKFPPPDKAADWIWGKLQSKQPQATMGMLNGLIRWAGEVAKFPVSGRQNFTAKADRPHVLVTGASQGIGAALRSEFERQGCMVTGLDLQGPDVVQTDLAQPETWSLLYGELAKLPPLNLVIHNAGISVTGALVKQDPAMQERVVAVNFLAPMKLNAELRQRGFLATDADFVFVSSLSYYAGYPGASVYAATKAGLAAYANSLRKAGPGRVLTVFPGPVRTAHAREHSPDNRNEYKRMDPAVLAAAVHQAWQKGSRRLIPGMANKFSAMLGWLMPEVMTRLMRKILFLKMH